jgi:hypothetical protein
MNPFLEPQLSQLTHNKALPIFYSVQMSGHRSLLTNHHSRTFASFSAALKTSSSSLALSARLAD